MRPRSSRTPRTGTSSRSFAGFARTWSCQLPLAVNTEPVTYETGRTDTFWVADLAGLSMYQVDADLLYVGDHAYWYFHKGYEPREQDLQTAARAFDESIYPTVTAAFGTELSPGIDNDPRLTILHTPLSSVAGYFSASDEYPKTIYPYSNEREMIYMSTGAFVGRPPYLGTLAHELQHAVHWAADAGEETWINEGLSEVAKNLADYGFTFVRFFAADPGAQLTTWPADNASTLPLLRRGHAVRGVPCPALRGARQPRKSRDTGRGRNRGRHRLPSNPWAMRPPSSTCFETGLWPTTWTLT